MKIGFFEKIIIINSEKFPRLIGKSGIVVGIGEDGGHVFGYDVDVDGEEEGYYFSASDIVGTGEFVDRSTIYDDDDPSSHVAIRVDGNGKGYINKLK